MLANRRINRTSILASLGLLALAVATGCGGAAAESAPPTFLTSAPVAPDTQAMNARLNQILSERDSAKQDAALAREQAAADREEDDRQQRAVRSYIDFETGVYARLDRVDSHLKALQTQVARATAARRPRIEKLLRNIASNEAKVQMDMRRIHKVLDADWSAFRGDVETTLGTVEHDLEDAEHESPIAPK